MHYYRCYNGYLQSNQHVERRRFDRSFNMGNNEIEKTEGQYVTDRGAFNYGNINGRTSSIGSDYSTSSLGSSNDQSFENSPFMFSGNDIDDNRSAPNDISNMNGRNFVYFQLNNFGINSSAGFLSVHKNVVFNDMPNENETMPDGPLYFNRQTHWRDILKYNDSNDGYDEYQPQRNAVPLQSGPLYMTDERMTYEYGIKNNYLPNEYEDTSHEDTSHEVWRNDSLDYENNVILSNSYSHFQHHQERPIQRSPYIDHFDGDEGMERVKYCSGVRYTGPFSRNEDYNSSLSREQGYDISFSRNENYNASLSREQGYDVSFSRNDGYDASFPRYEAGNGLLSRHEDYNGSFSRYEERNDFLPRYEADNTSLSGHEDYADSFPGYEERNDLLSRYEEYTDSMSRQEENTSIETIDGNQEFGIMDRNMPYEFEDNIESMLRSFSSLTTASINFQNREDAFLSDDSSYESDKEYELDSSSSQRSQQWNRSSSALISRNLRKRVLRERFLDNDSSNETEPSRKRIRTSTFSTTNMF